MSCMCLSRLMMATLKQLQQLRILVLKQQDGRMKSVHLGENMSIRGFLLSGCCTAIAVILCSLNSCLKDLFV